jgi:hypothetical protein
MKTVFASIPLKMKIFYQDSIFLGDVKISLQAGPWNEIVNSAKSVMVTFFGHVSEIHSTKDLHYKSQLISIGAD